MGVYVALRDACATRSAKAGACPVIVATGNLGAALTTTAPAFLVATGQEFDVLIVKP
jgi:hypothetical protein